MRVLQTLLACSQPEQIRLERQVLHPAHGWQALADVYVGDVLLSVSGRMQCTGPKPG